MNEIIAAILDSSIAKLEGPEELAAYGDQALVLIGDRDTGRLTIWRQVDGLWHPAETAVLKTL